QAREDQNALAAPRRGRARVGERLRRAAGRRNLLRNPIHFVQNPVTLRRERRRDVVENPTCLATAHRLLDWIVDAPKVERALALLHADENDLGAVLGERQLRSAAVVERDAIRKPKLEARRSRTRRGAGSKATRPG